MKYFLGFIITMGAVFTAYYLLVLPVPGTGYYTPERIYELHEKGRLKGFAHFNDLVSSTIRRRNEKETCFLIERYPEQINNPDAFIQSLIDIKADHGFDCVISAYAEQLAEEIAKRFVSAVMNRDLSAIAVLLHLGADPNQLIAVTTGRSYPVMATIATNERVKTIRRRVNNYFAGRPDIPSYRYETERVLVWDAEFLPIPRGTRPEELQAILAGKKVVYLDKRWEKKFLTPLHIAIERDHPELIKALARGGADYNIPVDGVPAISMVEEPELVRAMLIGKQQLSPLELAIVDSDLPAFQQHYQSMEQNTYQLATLAARYGSDLILQWLVETGALKNIDWPLVAEAAFSYSPAALDYLMQIGIKWDQEIAGQDALDWLVSRKLSQMPGDEKSGPLGAITQQREIREDKNYSLTHLVNYIFKHSGYTANELVYKAHSRNWTRIHMAAASADMKTIREMLLADPDVLSQKDAIGADALYIMVESGRTDGIAELVELGADINTETKRGATPLIRAAFNSDFPAIKALIDAGASLRTSAVDCSVAVRAFQSSSIADRRIQFILGLKMIGQESPEIGQARELYNSTLEIMLNAARRQGLERCQ